MRDFIDLVHILFEGDLVPFHNNKKGPPPEVIDHGNGMTSRRFDISNLADDDPPHHTNDIEVIAGEGSDPTSVAVSWDDYRVMDYPLFQIKRILKLRPGEKITLDAWGDNRLRNDHYPPRSQTVERKGGTYIVKVQHFTKDAEGNNGLGWTATDYAMNVHDFAVAAHKAMKLEKENHLSPEEHEARSRAKGIVVQEVDGKFQLFKNDGEPACPFSFRAPAFAWKYASTKL